MMIIQTRKRKGSVFDIPFIIVFMFIFATTIIVSFTLINGYNDVMQTTDIPYDVSNYTQSGITAVGTFDSGFVLLLGGLIISTILSAFFIQSHPAFFIVSLIALAIFIAIAVIFSNLYEEVETSAELSSSAANYPLISNIMSNLPIIVVAIGVGILIALYAKTR